MSVRSTVTDCSQIVVCKSRLNEPNCSFCSLEVCDDGLTPTKPILRALQWRKSQFLVEFVLVVVVILVVFAGFEFFASFDQNRIFVRGGSLKLLQNSNPASQFKGTKMNSADCIPYSNL